MCNPCLSTFDELETEVTGRSRALRLDEAQPLCRCQFNTVSQYSSGPVCDDEVLVRILISPFHFHKKRKTEPTAAALSNAEIGGLSVFRESQVTTEELKHAAEALVANARKNNPKAGVLGVLRMHCRLVRSLKTETETAPAYCAYDTAEKIRTSHAEIFQRVSGAAKDIQDSRRNKLFASVKDTFQPVSEFRSGLLEYLAPKQDIS